MVRLLSAICKPPFPRQEKMALLTTTTPTWSVWGVSPINRITTIKIYTGYTDVFNSLFIVRQICTYVREKTQQKFGMVTKSSSLEGSIVFDGGEYLRRVEFLGGRFIDNIRFQKTDGSWSNKWGGKLTQDHNHALQATNSVYQVIRSWVRRVTYPHVFVPCLRRIESITFASWILTLKKDFTPKVSNTTSPKAIEINNNLNGTISRSYMAIFKETIITTETTTVTKSRQFHVEVSQTTSAGFNVGVVSASGEVSISIGGSFSETPEEYGRTKTFEVTVERV